MVTIHNRTEGKRGCGYRKQGGLYLVTDPTVLSPCSKLPIRLDVCPTCRHGIKPSRGWTWFDPKPFLSGLSCFLTQCASCPLTSRSGELRFSEREGLLWIGPRHYTKAEWIEEAQRMGISRRVPAIPRGFKVGETWVFVAHREAVDADPDLDKPVPCPGIFHVFRPQRIEYVVKDGDAEEKLEKLEERGVTLVRVQKLSADELERVEQ